MPKRKSTSTTEVQDPVASTEYGKNMTNGLLKREHKPSAPSGIFYDLCAIFTKRILVSTHTVIWCEQWCLSDLGRFSSLGNLARLSGLLFSFHGLILLSHEYCNLTIQRTFPLSDMDPLCSNELSTRSM